ncbi:hypothetical protein A2U01_0068997, partial [Trifolium medium]|nr:hypothetical protein [Trifolium medium]
MEEDKEEDE